MVAARRQPPRDTAIRDAARSRTALLDAALAEFADKGFAGARVDAIAARAGVNKQLIAYYFDGKQGLYDAVTARREAIFAEFDRSEVPLPELARRYADAFRDHPDIERLFLRESLDGNPDDVEFDPDVPEVADLRRRQHDGELAADLDPAFVLLFLQAMTFAGSMFSAEAKRLTSLHPHSAEFHTRFAEQISRVVECLARPSVSNLGAQPCSTSTKPATAAR